MLTAGDTIRLTASDAIANVLTDPGAISLLLTYPNGTVFTYTATSTPSIFRDSIGLYHFDLLLVAGTYTAVWTATGTAADTASITFTALPAPITTGYPSELDTRRGAFNRAIDVDPWESDPEDFRGLIYGAPNSERLRWWRAVPDPTFAPSSASAQTNAGGKKWLHIEQPVGPFRALVGGTRIVARYVPQGEYLSGDITLTTMPDELPLSSHDYIVTMGDVDDTPAPIDARSMIYKETIRRGSIIVAQAGTIASSGTSVTGRGTQFTLLNPGDILVVARTPLGRIVSILNDTGLILDTPTALAGNAFSVAREQLKWDTSVFIDYCVDSAGNSYRFGSDIWLGRADDRLGEQQPCHRSRDRGGLSVPAQISNPDGRRATPALGERRGTAPDGSRTPGQHGGVTDVSTNV